MAISLSQLTFRTSAPKPPRILIHGVAGVGKTTFTAGPTILSSSRPKMGSARSMLTISPIARSFDEVIEVPRHPLQRRS